jgi:hypothetical protein
MKPASIHWKLSYDGECIYRWYGVADEPKLQRHKSGYLDLTVQIRPSWNPSKFNVGVYPRRIPKVGSVSLTLFASDGPPPQAALDALWELMCEEYLEYLEWANRAGFPAESVPARPEPVWFSMEKLCFVDLEGREAHVGVEP